ncbi:MAG: cation:proton antiporter [Myxococcales bacterium]|nr:cation:proton antiporter [Myxococcota bacterium]MDW8282613.1 cation:proton antiporter [Myxococcales bacterium]
MHFEIVTLFSVATAVALAVRWLKVPYTVALVVTGLVLGAAHALEPPNLTKELLYAVFLPGLLFEAAFHLEFRKFWQNKLAIHSLAVPGVAAAVALTAVMLTPVANALHFVDGFELRHGLVFAALIAATDPIAVVALFKSLGAPKRLAILMEGESLLNDGTAVVAFTLILGIVTGRKLSPVGALMDFIKVVGMGTLIGVTFGFAISKVIQTVDDPMIEITLTTIAAYGSFVTAEYFHYSGVIATVAAGMLCGNYGAHTGMSPSTRIAVESFWEYVAFALNSMVFLLIGFTVSIEALVASWKPILAAYLAVTLGRAAVIAGVSLLLRPSREQIPWSWSTVLMWGGLRGGLSMVLVLGLPPHFPHAELLRTMTFGVVIISILVQGLTMAPLLRRLGLVGSREDRLAYERERGLVRAKRAALSALQQMVHDGTVQADLVEPIRAEYQRHIAEAEQRISELHLQAQQLREEELHAARRHLLLIEKDTILAAYHKGFIGQDALNQLLQDVDARLFRLEAGEETSLTASSE